MPITNEYNPDVLSCLANLSNDEVFTPPTIVNQMLDMLPVELWSNPDTTFLDPACKTGIFLREIAKRLMDGLKEKIPNKEERANHIFFKQLFGIAITELTGLLSRRSVYCTKKANGKYSICSEFENEQGNILYTRLSHTWEKGRCRFCGASQEVYDRGDELESHAYQFIHTNHPEKIFNMRFDVIIGNPPYQLSDGGNGASAKPIYHLFIEKAKQIKPTYLCMIIPARWFAGGKGLDEFRNIMLNDSQIRYIKDYVNAKDCFPNNSISGGVCYFLWKINSKGLCDFTTVFNGIENRQYRKLNEFAVFVRYNDAVDIIHKVESNKFTPLSSTILSRNPFGIPSYERGSNKCEKDNLRLISSQGVGFIDKNRVLVNHEYIGYYKVMISKVTCEHAGEPNKDGKVKILSSVKVLEKNDVCTDSYLIIGKFTQENHADNLCGYLKTRFVRFLLLQAISSINLSKDKFQFVPLQDFSEPWTDEKLYKKYNLTAEEISFIESMIRPMD